MMLDEIKNTIVKFSDTKYKEVLTLKDFLKIDHKVTEWQLRKHGGYSKIVSDLGCTIPFGFTMKEVLEKLYIYIKTIGYVPYQREVYENKILHQDTLERKGGYKYLLGELGYEYPKWRAEDYTKEEMKEIFLNVYKDKTPMIKDVEEDYQNGNLPFSSFVIRSKFETLNNFIKYCGLKFNERMLHYYTDEEIIKMFLDKYGVTSPPLAEQVNNDYHNGEIEFSANMLFRHYDDYTTFLFMCGYKNIDSTYGIKCEAKDGHICDSKAEKIIDDFLYENNLSHQIHIKYKDIIDGFDKNNKVDFLLDNNIVVEYFGLMGIEKYEEKVKKKIKLLNENKIKYIPIYPKDLHNLEVIFMSYLDEGGIQCGSTY